MRFIGFVVLCFILSLEAAAQNRTILKGRIADSETNLPIPFVHIGIVNSSMGTISNNEGQFVLKVPANYSSRKIAFSCIGYETQYLSIADFTSQQSVELLPSKQLLSEVTITPEKVTDIVQRALEKIPENYMDVPTTATGFYRQAITSKKYGQLYISEAVLEVQKESYAKAHQKGLVKVIKSRKKEFYDEDELQRVKFYASPHLPHRMDFVMQRKKFIKNANSGKFKYELVTVKESNGSSVFEIAFAPKSELLNENAQMGTMFINEDYVFLRAEFLPTEHKNSMNITFEGHSRRSKVNYQEFNGKYYLQNIWYEINGYDKVLNDTIQGVVEFIVTEIDITNQDPIPYEERLQFGDVFIDHVGDFDPTFWDNYNIVEHEKSVKKHIVDQELHKKSLASDYETAKEESANKSGKKKDFLQSSVEIAKRLKTSVGVNATPLTVSNSITNIDVNNEVLEFGNSSSIGYGLSISYSFLLKDGLYVDLYGGGSFGKVEFGNYMLGVSYEVPLTKDKRPFFIKPGVGLSFSEIRNKLNEVKTSLDVNGKSLEDPIDIFIRKNIIAIQPSLTLSLELSHRWELFISSHYLIRITEKDLLEYKESSGFFPKKTSVDLISADITLTNNGIETKNNPLDVSDFQFNIGVTLKFSQN